MTAGLVENRPNASARLSEWMQTTMSTLQSTPAACCDAAARPDAGSPIEPKRRALAILILLFVALATLVPVFTGPLLGDHEALVAQCARDMRLSGNWLVPHYLGDPYVRKPPLPYWMIAGLSYIFPADPATQLPVTTTLARLPSAVAAFGTVVTLWILASAMFTRRVGQVAAVMAASSLFFLLYAANATVEMILTFCCTWAYAHFWFAIHQPLGSGKRHLHFFLYYLALGLGMMAKGPFPMAMVGFPICIWWYCDQPLSFVALGTQRAWDLLVQGGAKNLKPALNAYAKGWSEALRDFFAGFASRTVRAFRELWLFPGLLVFAACFVPWMILVGKAHPHAWNLWNWQYLQRVEGNYDDTRHRGIFYYVPVIAGLILPWLFALPEAILAPWIAKYAHQRRALLFAGIWALVGALIMSVITFKKPYYVAPMIPGLIILLAVVAERFYSSPLRKKGLAWAIWGGFVLFAIAGVITGYFLIRRDMPDAAGVLTIITSGTALLLAIAGLVFIVGRPWMGFGLTAATAVLAFTASWHICGEKLDNVGKVKALNDVFVKNNVPANARICWLSRPDSRLSFYYNRITRQLVQPAEIVDLFVDRTKARNSLRQLVVERATQFLKSPEQVYLVIDRDEYGAAKMGFAEINDIARLVGFAPDENKKESDWMIITNHPATRPAQ